MGVLIEDGKGKGFSAEVDSDNRLATRSTSVSEAHHISEDDGQAYMTDASTTANALTLTATAGAILLIRNDSDDKDLVIHIVTVSTSAAGTILILRKNDTIGTIADNNTETPENMNFTSGNVANATVYSWDEQNNGLGGLTPGPVLHTGYIAVGTTPLTFDDAVVLGKNDNFVIATVLGTPEFTANVQFYFND